MTMDELILLGPSAAFEILFIVLGNRLKPLYFTITSIGVFVIAIERRVFFNMLKLIKSENPEMHFYTCRVFQCKASP